MTARARLFHRYLGAHSLLIGLLPFFVPVYLWELGLSLAGLCLLVGVSGLGFAAALGPWQRLSRTRSLAVLVGWTFALELLLVVLVAVIGPLLGEASGDGSGASRGTAMAPAAPAVIIVLALANGAYNAFYWTTQRTLFAALGSVRDTGRRYGNLQIFVAVFLKLGILIGGLLLEAGALHWILLLSAVTGALATWWLARDAGREPLQHEPVVRWRRSLAWRDGSGSVGVFRIDGLFLYLESHFWTLSLFLLVREDHSRLGVVVVVLGILFALLFLLVKNRIDRPGATEIVYRTSVTLYALSWLLRLAVDGEAPASLTLALLVGVTFCSSLFRLAFNKRFFDLAREGGSEDQGPVAYLIVKSHVSQTWMAAVFIPLALLVHASALPAATLLDGLYLIAAPLALGYLLYRRPQGVVPKHVAVESAAESATDMAAGNATCGRTGTDGEPTATASLPGAETARRSAAPART